MKQKGSIPGKMYPINNVEDIISFALLFSFLIFISYCPYILLEGLGRNNGQE